MAKLSISNLEAGYGKIPVIKGLDLQISEGEIVTLIGPNGAGKSTILKTVGGLLPLLNGDVCIENESILKMSPKERAKHLSIMLTDKNEVEYMTCKEVVGVGRYRFTGMLGGLDKSDEEEVRRTMEKVDITNIAERNFMKISDGQRQRVLLARALVAEPEILLLDEPTGFLDIGYKLEFLTLLKSTVKEKGMSVLMSMHEIELAAKISDRVVCINRNNEIDMTGKPGEILTPEYIEKLFNIKPGIYGEFY